MRRISWWAGALEGVKKEEKEGGASADDAGAGAGAEALPWSEKSDCHVSEGVRSGCYAELVSVAHRPFTMTAKWLGTSPDLRLRGHRAGHQRRLIGRGDEISKEERGPVPKKAEKHGVLLWMNIRKWSAMSSSSSKGRSAPTATRGL